MSGLLYIEETCTVCAEDFGVERKIHSIACGHVFCRECLDTFDPRVCPVCREMYGEADIECIGPWEEEPSATEEPDHDDEGWDPAALDRIHEEEHIWMPSDADREADMKARDELGLPRDQDEERWEQQDASQDDRKLDWALSDSEYAEDSAAWDELGLRV